MTLTKPADLKDVEFTEEGYMADPTVWTPEIAEAIAEREGISLTERHWVVIQFARDEFEQDGHSPSLRRITTSTDVSTKEIYSLFPGGPAGLASKIAGLRKPTGCI